MVHPILTCRSIQAEDSFTQITGIFFGGFVSLSYFGGFSYTGGFVMSHHIHILSLSFHIHDRYTKSL